ncbi:MAG: AAA family ATPase [Gaiellaceae bacterium]|jgi:hypothetical protein
MTIEPEPSLHSHSWQPIDLAALGNNPPPATSISGLLYPGNLCLVYGEPEAVKTWIGLVLSMEQIRADRHVVYVDFEMSASAVRARLLDLGATDEDLQRFHYISPSESIMGKQIQIDIAAMVAEYDPSLIVFDAMAGALALHGFDGNSNADVETFYSVTLTPFRSSGAALAVIDHVTKDRETRGRWPIGAQRKLGGADVGILVEMISAFARGQTGLAKLRVQKDRHGALHRPYACELELASDAGTGHITWTIKQAQHKDGEDGDQWRPTALMQKVFVYLKEQSEPVTRKAISDAVTGKKAYIAQAIDCLIADGAAEEQPGARGSKLISLSAVPGCSQLFPEHVGTPEGTPPVPGVPSLHRGTGQREQVEPEPDLDFSDFKPSKDDIPF